MSSSRWVALSSSSLLLLTACSEDPATVAPARAVAGSSGAMPPTAAGTAGGLSTGVAGASGAAAVDSGLDAGSPLDAAAASTSDAAPPQTTPALDAAAPGAMPTAGSGAVAPDAAPPADAAAPSDSADYAKELDGLFLDVKCDAATRAPLEDMATCLHLAGTQMIELPITFGGDATKTYEVKLRVRGIWEPTTIQGGERPLADQPFTVGGMVPPGSNSSDAINYQQYSIRVSQPEQTYWLNDHQYVAHDIHKDDYEATLEIAGGSRVVVSMYDGNDHEIANWTEDYFEGLAPYATMPSLGQELHLDVVAVTEKP